MVKDSIDMVIGHCLKSFVFLDISRFLATKAYYKFKLYLKPKEKRFGNLDANDKQYLRLSRQTPWAIHLSECPRRCEKDPPLRLLMPYNLGASVT